MATEVLVPPLGTTVDTVTLVKWYRAEGEHVQRDDPLFAIETDKSTMDIEAPASGILRNVTAQEGDEVAALTCIGLIVAPGEEVSAPAVTAAGKEADVTPVAGKPAQVSAAIEPSHPVIGSAPTRKFISPRAKRLADQHNVPAHELHGTGPEGAIIERDVRAYLDRLAEGAPSVPATADAVGVLMERTTPVAQSIGKTGQVVPVGINEVATVVPLRSVRAVIAERMAESVHTTARVTLTCQSDATSLVALRRQLTEDSIEVSYNDIFLLVLGHALREYPQMNASIVGDAIQVWQRIHIGLAVDTDRGLLVPVLRDVDTLGLRQLAEASRKAIDAAVEGRSLPEDLQGGTFTLTNLGMYGVDAFTPVINLPECGILGVGRIAKVPAVVGDAVVARHMVWLSLTFDHRLVDGAPAARFLQRVVQLIEKPHLLLVA